MAVVYIRRLCPGSLPLWTLLAITDIAAIRHHYQHSNFRLTKLKATFLNIKFSLDHTSSHVNQSA
jgi:hypothetical protein